MDLINILIRTGSRPDQFRRCLESVRNQTYKNIRIICSFDKTDIYVPDDIETIRVATPLNLVLAGTAYWNLYCNSLKSLVKEGFFMFLDDDDELIDNGIIEKVVKYLKDPDRAYIFQMERWGERIPSDQFMKLRIIKRKHVGNPCLFLNAKYKNIAMFDNRPAADFRFIRRVTSILPTEFIKEVVVKVHEKSNGKSE